VLASVASIVPSKILIHVALSYFWHFNRAEASPTYISQPQTTNHFGVQDMTQSSTALHVGRNHLQLMSQVKDYVATPLVNN
ncbi:hypothetical protein ACSYAD_36520, partial [Acaryochloris marina NIES-2412]|uniref:hypothetical protein n=1 Tax=Acaryochloris marina TaxID=155978 RepID=UPI0040587579